MANKTENEPFPAGSKSPDALYLLEFLKVVSLLARFTRTGPGRVLAEQLIPGSDQEQIEASLAEISEIVEILGSDGPPPVAGCEDLQPSLHQLRAEGFRLDAAALLQVLGSVDAAAACRNFITDSEAMPRLNTLAKQLDRLALLGKEIRQAIGQRGEILDSASFLLGDLRDSIKASRSRIRRALEGLLADERLAEIFQDHLVTERNGRYVVPVKVDYRGRLKGFVHDTSASGQTLFIEPVTVLDWNNELQTQFREAAREEERVLQRLSDVVRKATGPLLNNQKILARFDFLQAAGQFSLACKGTAPMLVDRPLLDLKAARHPLLHFNPDGSFRKQPVVPVDLHLAEDQAVLVISGPNTGGKTVALKTAGLLILMVRAGLHIPCAPESRVYLFEPVLADIGDDQSIEQSLSTFSGHLTRIKDVLKWAGHGSLVLLDEAGTGTDPDQGSALALAILDQLRTAGAKTMVTTHLSLMKTYAHLEEGVGNAAVEFDLEGLMPTYRLHYGIPGSSNAFTIARTLGLPEELLERAEQYLGERERETQDLVARLNQLHSELEEQLVQTRARTEEANREVELQRSLREEQQQQGRKVLEAAHQQGETLLREAEVQIRGLLKKSRQVQPQPKLQAEIVSELKEIDRGLEKLRTAPASRGAQPTGVAVGERLWIPQLQAEGVVARLLADGAELTIKGKKMRLPLANLEQYQPRRFVSAEATLPKVRDEVTRDSFLPRLVLVGKRVDDANALLERFLDEGLLHGFRQLEVVHGAGEGILRRAVREFLAKHREVSSFQAADLSGGGENVTIVELRG